MPGGAPATPPFVPTDRRFQNVLDETIDQTLDDTTTDPATPAASTVVPSPTPAADARISDVLSQTGVSMSDSAVLDQQVTDYITEGISQVPSQAVADQPILTLSTILSPAGPNAGPILAEAISYMQSIYGTDTVNRLRLELLSPDQKAAVVAQLEDLKDLYPQVANLLEGDVPERQIQALTNSAALLAGGDYFSVFTPEEGERLKQIANDWLNQTVRTGSFDIDEEFARSHPLQAIAMSKIMESVGVPVKIGGGGVMGTLGSVLEGVLASVDVLQSGLSVIARYAGHGLSEFAENISQATGQLPTEDEALEIQTRLREAIQNGEIPDDQLDDAYMLLDATEDITAGIPSPMDLFDEVLNPVQRGNSLAEQIFRSGNITPEDPEWAWGTNVLGGVLAFTRLDPLNALGMVLRGAKLATRVPLPEVLRLGSAEKILEAGIAGVKTLDQANEILLVAKQYIVGLTHNSLTRRAYMANATTAGEWATKAVVSPGGRTVIPAVEWANQTWRGMQPAVDRAGWLADNLPGMFTREDLAVLATARGPGQLLDYVVEGLAGVRSPARVTQLTEDLSRVTAKLDRYNYLRDLSQSSKGPLRGNSALEFTELQRQLPQLMQEQLTLQRSLRAGRDMRNTLSAFPRTQMSGVLRGAFPGTLSKWERALTYFYGRANVGKALHRFVEDFPTGTIHNPALRDIKGELSDFGTQSLATTRNLLYRLDVPLFERQRLLGNFVRIADPGEFKVWVDDLTDTIASNIKDPQMAALWRDYSKRVFEERVDDIVNTVDNVGFATYEPTGFQVKLDTDGTPVKSPVPVWPSDYLRGYDVPMPDMIIETISAKRRLLRQIGKSKHGKPLEQGLRALIEFNNSVHYIWKMLVLGTKLPFSLAMRVIGEEQARIAAYGYASLVNNPVQWWSARKGLGEFARFTGKNTDEMLGLMIDQLGLRTSAKMGQHILKNTDRGYYDAVAGMLAHRNSDPLARMLLKTEDNANVIAWLSREDNALGRAWLRNAELMPFTPEELLDRMRFSLDQLTGGIPEIKMAVVRGKIKVGDDLVEIGSHEASDYLRVLRENGEWEGPRFIPGSKIDILPARVPAARRFRDWWFKKYFSNPDLNWSRRPLFRQIANTEYKRLRTLGYTEKAATRAAEVYGARQTADLLYDLAVRTSPQYFARNLVPFGAAFQELINTWFLRIPGRTGIGIGHAVLARKADAFLNAIESTGLVAEDPRTGQKFITLPPLNALYRALTGTDAPTVIGFNLKSLNMITNNLLPGLGPVSAMALGQLANRFDPLTDVFDLLLPFGSDTPVGPTAVNNLWIAATALLGEPTPPPWELTTWTYQRMLINSALDDAARQARIEKGPPPDPNNYPDTEDGQADYQVAAQVWRDDMIRATEKKGMIQYLFRGLAAMVLPAPPQFTDEFELEMTNIWKEISVFPDGSENTSDVLRAFQEENPDAVWYPIGKTFGVPKNVTTWDDWLEAFRDGKIRSLDYKEYIEFAAGQESYRAYINAQRDNIERAAGDGGAAQLLRDWNRRQDSVQTLRDEFDRYLAWNTTYSDLRDDMLRRQVEAASAEDAPEHQTLQVQRALELQRLMKELEETFTVNGLRDADFQSVLAQVRELTDGVTFGPATSQINKDLDWYWENVGIPYYEQVGALYDQAFDLPEAERGPVFDQIRQLKDLLAGQTHRGQSYPTPEEVGYASLSDEGQAQKRLEWLTKPIEWLSRFEREMVGLPTGDSVDRYLTEASRLDQAFDTHVTETMMSTSSSEYQRLKAAVEKSKQSLAEELGVSDVYTLSQMPVYRRLGTLGISTNPTFARISDSADQIWRTIMSAGLTPGGPSPTARVAQAWLISEIERARSSDPEFDRLMTSLEYAMAPSGADRLVGADMYMRVFFDYFGPVPAFGG